jgi:hypothetical protein
MVVGERSEWQRRVEGTWYGCPAVFAPDGRHVGRIRVERTVRLQHDGSPEIVVTNDLEVDDPAIAERIGIRELVLRITEGEHGRVYDGRDFDGSGTPYGRLLLGQDFIRPWGLDTVVAVQVLPDGVSQLYSNFAHLGPRLVVALGGRYVVDPDDVEGFLAAEAVAGAVPFDWSDRAWSGEVEVHDGSTSSTLPMRVELASGELLVEGGGLPVPLRSAVRVTGAEVQLAGAQLHGNGQAYGPMVFTTRHVTGRPLRLQTRDVQLDGGRSLAIAWQHWVSGGRTAVVNGVLHEEGSA